MTIFGVLNFGDQGKKSILFINISVYEWNPSLLEFPFSFLTIVIKALKIIWELDKSKVWIGD